MRNSKAARIGQHEVDGLIGKVLRIAYESTENKMDHRVAARVGLLSDQGSNLNVETSHLEMLRYLYTTLLLLAYAGPGDQAAARFQQFLQLGLEVGNGNKRWA